ncbi:MAG: hypothetical protein FWD17_06315, partial [Polyangiaceae bacterium]|nr:hypothetical protein [Polyangiaceae bacterium]
MLLPTGKFISPTAIPGSSRQVLVPQIANWPSNLAADEAVKSQLSPDGNTLAILTSGFNSVTLTDGTGSLKQFIFIYDVSGANKTAPKLMQTITQNNAFVGLVWSDNTTLYVSGGPDDSVYVYTRAGAAPSAPFAAAGAIALGHTHGIGISAHPTLSGLALSADGKTLIVANYANDSVSVVDTASKAVVSEYDLRPFSTSGQDGVAGGEFPWAVALKADGIAFISSVRDREIVVVDVSTPASPKFVERIALPGNPYGLTLSADQSKLFVGQENADEVAVIDTVRHAVVATIDTQLPHRFFSDDRARSDAWGRPRDPHYSGAQPIALTVSPDGRTLYAVNNGNNSIAVIPLAGPDAHTVKGLIPTAYAPKDITFSADGSQMYIINGLSNTGPNPGYDFGGANQYQFALEQASLVIAPVPTGHVLDELTERVARNNGYSIPESERDIKVMNFLHEKLKHVIYIKRENRTFDQVLGDLNNGSNGDPSLTMFGAAIRPNDHALAKNFVTLDNFMDPGDGSNDGWFWLLYGGVTTSEEITQQNTYAGRPFNGQGEARNDNVTVQLLTTAARDAATNGSFSAATGSLPGGTVNVLPGPGDISAIDAPFGYQKSTLWDVVLHAGGTVRAYAFMGNNIGASTDASGNAITDPFAAGVVQFAPVIQTLADGRTDVYFRSVDFNYPDTWRYQEWLREFRQFEANGDLPSLMMVDFRGDHMGNLGTAPLSTPELQQADNDFAVGKLIEAVAHSPRYSENTLVIVIEDDAQDGPDHLDSHRAPAWVVGPYVKRSAVVSTFYTLLSPLRTIEDILGTEHMNLNTAYTRPMADAFDIGQSPKWTFDAVASTVLQNSILQGTLDNLGAK